MARDSARIWKKRITDAKSVCGRWVQRSDPYVAAYDGRFPASLTGDVVDNINSNYVIAVTRAYVSNLFFRNPRVVVPAARPSDLEDAHIAQAVINRVIEECDMETSFADAMTDAVLRGSGYLKFGYHTESHPAFDEDVVVNSADEDVHKENEKILMGMDVEAQEDEDHDKHLAGHQALLDSPEVLAGLIDQQGEGGALKLLAHMEQHKDFRRQKAKAQRVNWRVQPQQVWVRHIDPRDVLLDPNATKFEDCRWIAFRSVRALEELRRDPRYRNKMKLDGSTVPPHQQFDGSSEPQTVGEQIQAAVLAGGSRGGTQSETSEQDNTDLQVELYEVWDRLTERIYVVCDQIDEFLRDEPIPYNGLPGLFPLVKISFAHKRGTGGDSEAERPYGYSLIEPWWTEQLELNALESLRLTIAKSNLPKYVADASVPDNALERITNGEVGVVVKLDANVTPEIAKDPRLALTQVQMGQVSLDLHQSIMNVRDMISFKAGLGEIQLGQSSTARTATATQVQVASQSAILDKMLDTIENAFKHAARIIRALIRQYYTQERVIALEGPEGAVWKTYLGKDLYGDELMIDTRTSAAANDQVRKFAALQMFNLLGANPAVKIRPLTEWLLRAYDIPTPSIFLKTEQEIAQEQQMMMAMQAGAQGAGQPLDVQLAQTKTLDPAQVSRNSMGDMKQDRSML